MTTAMTLSPPASSPPAAPEAVARALTALTGERDRAGVPIAKRALTEPEKALLKLRLNDLRPFVDPASIDRKAQEITAMLMGFGGQSLTAEQARLTAAQYARTCADLPLWAVSRACHRFAAGQVKPEEIDEERISLTFRPTTAQLYQVAAAIAKPVLEERFRISAVLRATVLLPRREPTEEEKAAVAEKIRDLTARLGAGNAERDAERTGRLMVAARESRQQNARLIEREYRAAGLEPPPWVGDMPPASLSLMLSVGYRIEEDARGKKMLVRPAPPPPAERRKRAELDDEIPF